MEVVSSHVMMPLISVSLSSRTLTRDPSTGQSRSVVSALSMISIGCNKLPPGTLNVDATFSLAWTGANGSDF